MMDFVGDILVGIFKALLYLAKKVLDLLIGLVYRLFDGVSAAIKRGKLEDMVGQFSMAYQRNEEMLAIVKSVQSQISMDANPNDVEKIGRMVSCCENAANQLSRYQEELSQNMYSGNEVNVYKYKSVLRNIRYPMTDNEVKELLNKYQSCYHFIETMLKYAEVENVRQDEARGDIWYYNTSRAFFTLLVDEGGQIVHTFAKPNPSVVLANATMPLPSRDILYGKKLSAYFDENNQLVICHNCSMSEVNHYDLSEFFDFIFRLIHKKEIIPFADNMSLSETSRLDIEEAMFLIEKIEGEDMQNVKQVAPPPVDFMPDNEKLYNGKKRWAHLNDISSNGMLSPQGFIIGKFGYGSYVYTGEYSGNILTIASPRSGKGCGVVVPNLLRHKGSVVVLDPKGENFFITARKRSELGNRVYYYDPWNIVDRYREEGRRVANYATKATINPLDFIEDDLEFDAGTIAESFISRTDPRADFFDSEAADFIMRLIVYVCTTYPIGDPNRTLLSVRALITERPETLQRRLLEKVQTNRRNNINPHPQVISLLTWLDNNISRPTTAFQNCLQIADRSTRIIEDPGIQESLEHSNIVIRNSRTGQNIKTTPTSLYLLFEMDHLVRNPKHYQPLIRLMINTCMMAASVESIPDEKMLFMLDEIAQLGNLAYLPSLLSIYNGKGVVVWTIWQNLSQIQANYEKEWKSILSNSDVHQYFGVNDNVLARDISEKIGKTTIYRETYTRGVTEAEGINLNDAYGRALTSGSYRGFNFSFAGGYGENNGMTRNYTDSYNFSCAIQIMTSRMENRTLTKETVPLIEPDEIQIGEGVNAVQFVFYRRCPYPILSGKIRYFEDKGFDGEYDKNITLIN